MAPLAASDLDFSSHRARLARDAAAWWRLPRVNRVEPCTNVEPRANVRPQANARPSRAGMLVVGGTVKRSRGKPDPAPVERQAMTTWFEGPFLGFDTETTGVDVHTDRIVTAALVERSGSGVGATTTVTTWIADPGVDIPQTAAAIHGVTTEIARRDGRPAVEVIHEVARRIAAAQRAGVPVVAFNAPFDLAILDAELTRHGLPTLPQRLGRPVYPVLDPLVIDRGVDRYRRGKRTLTHLCTHYGVAATSELHRADADVVATLDLLARMAEAHPPVREQTLEQLHAWQIAKHREWAESFNAWLAARNRPSDVSTSWPVE